MDQDAFRKTYSEVNERFCAYEKAVLTNQCNCSLAEKFCIAEREGVHCKSDEGQQQCLQFLEILREQAKFALRTTTSDEHKLRLPHGKAIRIQVGGLRGLRQLLQPNIQIQTTISDINALLTEARTAHGDFNELPFSHIMPHIASYEVKKRAHRRKKDQ